MRSSADPVVPAAARRATLFALLCALSLGNGCSEFSPVETPPNLSARCRDEDTDPLTPVSFERDILQGIFRVNRQTAPGCSCHDPNDALPVGFQMSGLDLTSHSSTLRGGTNTGANAVIPGQPCSSVLYLKVTESPPIGARMPRNGPPFLSATQIKLIHDWISEGARAN